MFQVSGYRFQNKTKGALLAISIVALLLAGSHASAATLYAGSASQTVEQGQTFVVEWYLDTQGTPVNTVSLKLHFSPATLEAVSVEAGASALSLWMSPPAFSNADGVITLAGGIPSGVNAPSVNLFRATFRARAPGAARISMDPASLVLAADGKGTPQTVSFRQLDFVIVAAGTLPVTITSPTHPDQNAWYSARRVVLRFPPHPNEQYSYSFSSNPDMFPGETAQPVTGDIIYDHVPDGIYYFKVSSKIGTGPWQEAGIFRVQIDATPPEAFTPRVAHDPDVFGGVDFLSFSTVDKTSGILHYKIDLGPGLGIIETQSPYKITRPLFGSKIEVEAIDRAGNVRKSAISYPGYVTWPVAGAAALGGVMVFAFIKLLLRLKRR